LLDLISHPSTLPVPIDVYDAVTPLFQRALGIYFKTTYYIAKKETIQKHGTTNIFYPRMIYDLISMFGLHLFYIEVSALEFLLRKVYHAISFKD
jgi:hypothetical protein